jgi:nucleotide-binding universal stress UspA family protein
MTTGYDAYPRPTQAAAAPTRAMGSPIVVGSCGTWDSNGAIRFAQLLAKRNGRAVYVVGVVDTDSRPASAPDESSPNYDARAVEALLARIERQLVELGVPDGRWPVGIVGGDRCVGRHRR